MPPVFPQVSGDPVPARFGDKLRGPHRIRMIAAPGIANGGNMVDIDAQTLTGRGEQAHGLARLPGFSAGVAASSGGSVSPAGRRRRMTPATVMSGAAWTASTAARPMLP